jgi:hypothetical protein
MYDGKTKNLHENPNIPLTRPANVDDKEGDGWKIVTSKGQSIFVASILGQTVGCGIQRKHINKLPRLQDEYISVTRKDTADADFIIPDSREGWVSFLGHVLRAFFETGESFTYSTVLIRPAGRPIKGFGGVASGAENLCSGLRDIVNILNKARGRKLRSVECMDIIDIIASIVVSGNVRRSAIIMIGDYDDIEYLNAKRWDLGGIPNWRAMSNNSIDVSDISQIPPEFWEGYCGNGEPYGLVNLDLCRRVGRLADGGKYPDPEVEGFNPCAEIPLAPWQTCCLAEIFLPNIQTPEELERTAILLYRICKHSLSLDCHQRETLRAVRKDYRIGIGITGYLQSTSEQQSWLSDLYVSLRKYDKMYSRKHGLPESIKLTTVKPSGTLSLLAGVTPGCHPGLFKYFIRRIRVSTNNPLVQTCKKAGYATEFQRRFDGAPDTSTTIIEFPCSYPDSAVLAKDTTAIDQLEIVKRLQTEWSDNAVSCTVYYRPHELDSIKEWLAENYTNSVKSVSFGAGDVVIADLMETYGKKLTKFSFADIYICVMNENSLGYAQDVAQALRKKGLRIAVDYSLRKVGDQIKNANKVHIPSIICIGDEEVKTGKLKIKNLESGEEKPYTI